MPLTAAWGDSGSGSGSGSGLLGSTLSTVVGTTTNLVSSIDGDTSAHSDAEANASGYDQRTFPGSLYNTARMINADDYWDAGYDGSGIDVALIDTGIAKVPGLDAPGKVIDGPDVSLDANGDALDGVDAYGHGTHMGGIIAGLDAGAPTDPTKLDDFSKAHFVGIAPGSRIVNVKAGAANGALDVTQLVSAIDWVVQHRNDGGRNIRVLSLSVGTTGIQSYQVDPLMYAVENAWRHGIVVVVSAGNNGVATDSLDNPAYDPFVIAVGALDNNGTGTRSDDFVADFSSRGDILRRPDFVAPGRSVVSLRDPGSYIDTNFSDGVVGTRFFKGSGTSQATAVAAGAAALLLDRYPDLSPDQVKALLSATGRRLPLRNGVLLDRGMRTIDLAKAADAVKDVRVAKIVATQMFVPGNGLGSIEAARGDDHLTDGVNTLSGESDLAGRIWQPQLWSAATAAGTAWSNDQWLGLTWANASWSAKLWDGLTWDGRFTNGMWDGSKWNGSMWRGSMWNGSKWNGSMWRGSIWG